MRLADACWMAVTGGIISLGLGVISLVANGLGLAGRALDAGLELARRPAPEGRSAHPFRALAATAVLLAAALVLIQITAEVIEGHNTRRYSPPEAFDTDRPARQAREPGRMVSRAHFGKYLAASE